MSPPRARALWLAVLLGAGCQSFDTLSADYCQHSTAAFCHDAGAAPLRTLTLTLTLTVSGAGTLNGLYPDGGPFACPGPRCLEALPAGTPVALTPSPDGGNFAWAWGADCADAGASSRCALTLDQDRTAAITFGRYNLAFVTRAPFTPGSPGGLPAADALCQADAADAGLPGTFVAFLGLADGGHPAFERLQRVPGWVRPDLRPVALSADALARAQVYYPASVDALGQLVHVGTWTGTQADGGVGGTCADWTSTDAGTATGGITGWAGERWVDDGTGPDCAATAHLYCFQTDAILQAPAPPPPPTGSKRAFISTPVYPGNGVDAFTTQCNADARLAGLSGSYAPLLLTTDGGLGDGLPSATVLGPGWYRVDGVQLAADASDVLHYSTATPGFPRLWAPLDLDAAGALQLHPIWTGVGPSTTDGSAPGTLANTCSDWSNSLSFVSAGVGASGSPWGEMYSSTTVPCNQAARVYCLQR